MKKRTYITTSIAYANAKPHIGHALEAVQSDALVRYYKKQKGEENVFFLTGTDEHGQKNYETAKKQGIKTQELVDQNAQSFKDLYKKVDVKYNRFIRTTDEVHKKAAQKIWKACEKDIYKKSYQGLYCVGCETFITEKELVDGKCPNHNTEPKPIEEENYFFKLSNYTDKIIALIESEELKVLPLTRRNEILSLLKNQGLEDISISRQKDRLPWGVTVPGDDTQVMYVWFDALTNYITGAGYQDDEEAFEKWWGEDSEVIHMIGKDIIRHHVAVWPGMLLSAGIPLPNTVLVHGFITSENKKMSKSIGNVIDPEEMIEKYGSEALRYYLLREIPTDDDGDFTVEQFEKRYTADLQNDLGNLFSRATNMIEKFLDGKVESKEVAEVEIAKEMEGFTYHKALAKIWDKVQDANKYIEDNKPWELAKTDEAKLKQVLENLHKELLVITYSIKSFMPETAGKLLAVLEADQISKPEPLFPRIEE